MILIAGLGNPEREYKHTRHNIGFETINKLAYDNNIEINKAKFHAHIGEGFIGHKKVLLVKPQTYMNLSGESIRDIMAYYKLELEDLIVVCDDINLEVGEIRIRKKGSAGGQNGLKNIIYHLESDEFVRVRVGIGEKPSRMDLKDFVLSRFKNEEHEKMVEGVTKATDAIEWMIKDSVDNAMNKFNKKKVKSAKEPKEERENKEPVPELEVQEVKEIES